MIQSNATKFGGDRVGIFLGTLIAAAARLPLPNSWAGCLPSSLGISIIQRDGMTVNLLLLEDRMIVRSLIFVVARKI